MKTHPKSTNTAHSGCSNNKTPHVRVSYVLCTQDLEKLEVLGVGHGLLSVNSRQAFHCISVKGLQTERVAGTVDPAKQVFFSENRLLERLLPFDVSGQKCMFDTVWLVEALP